MAPGLRRKSGVSTSTVVPGLNSRMARIVCAKCSAPPSARSSRSTDVITTCLRPSFATARPTFAGSSESSGPGNPVFTLQKAQARVQVSPMIIMVACLFAQHSPILGQPASSQTVCSRCSRTIALVSAYSRLTGAFTRIQSGLRCTAESGRCAFSGWRAARRSFRSWSKTMAIVPTYRHALGKSRGLRVAICHNRCLG